MILPLRLLLLASLALALLAPANAGRPAGPPAAAVPADPGWLYEGSDIAPDPAWRFGTLPNGVRYALRRNAHPPGQVSIRVRIAAGSLHEQDHERGWAHYVEHLLFRGSENYPDRHARQAWQQLGATFGSDTNARTSPTETVYQLNLPSADSASLDTSLAILADMMVHARFAPEAVESERPIILAEKSRRPLLTQRVLDVSHDLFNRGLRIAERDTIGTEATLRAADAQGLKAFYRLWYRPERAIIVMAGDADPEMMEALIARHFGGWQGKGPAPVDPPLGELAPVEMPVANLAYPGAPLTGTLMWLRPSDWAPHTIERERLYLAETLAGRIINRRLESHARGQSAFINASLETSRSRSSADATRLTIVAHPGRWQEALEEAFAILADARRAPPTEAEIDREIRNLRNSAGSAVRGEDTVQSQRRADQLLRAIARGSVVASAQTVLDNFEANVPLMTPARLASATAAMFQGTGPRMLLVSPERMEGGAEELAEGLALAQAVVPAQRPADRAVTFADLPRLGRPGRIVSTRHIEDMGVTIVRFANGSTLTFKPTRFEQGSVAVRLRFGHGLAGLAPDRPSLGWLGGLVGPSGLAGLDLEGMERLLTGRSIALSFRVEEDAFVLAGQTNAADLADQLRLLTAKLTHPEWDSGLFDRFRAGALESFDLHFASASARAAREMSGFTRPNDQRWRTMDREEIAGITADQFRDFYAPHLMRGPVHAVIVGDATLDQAVDAVRRTVGSLGRRPAAHLPPERTALQPPLPDPRPAVFTHRGDPDQAFAMIGWSTLGGRESIRDRRALTIAASLFQARLFDRLREDEGATYSPNAAHSSSDSFPDWGIFYATAELRPDRADAFFRIAREILADLAARPAAPEEFARAQNPIVSGIERRLATNAYWVGAIENWTRFPAEIDNVRAYFSDYAGIDAEEVRRAVAAHVADEGDWSMLVLPDAGSIAAADPQGSPVGQ